MGILSLWVKLSRNPEPASNPESDLAQARQKLDEILPAKVASHRIDEEGWACYQQALVAATKCGADAVTSLVLAFNLWFVSGPPRVVPKNGRHEYLLDTRPMQEALTILLANEPVPDQTLEAAYRLAKLVGDIAQIIRVEHLIYDPDAELDYLLQCPGTEAACRAVKLSERLVHSPGVAIKAHNHAGEAFFQEADYVTAAEHFLKAKETFRASDCHLLLGRIPDALQLRRVSPSWLATVRERTDLVLREFVQNGASLEAIRLVRGTATSLRGHERIVKSLRAENAKSLGTEDNEEYIRSEAARLEDILDSLVRTARTSLTEESRNAGPGAEVFRRWSAIEEAAGNFLEAGLQAESGQDYVTAALMFEEAGAFEQALHAFDRSPRIDLQRRAELLEGDRDFSRAGRLYKRLGQTEKVTEMEDMEFEQGGFCAGN